MPQDADDWAADPGTPAQSLVGERPQHNDGLEFRHPPILTRERLAELEAVLEAAIDAALDSLRDTITYGIFLLLDYAEDMPEGEQREALEHLIGRLERNIDRELGWLPAAMAEALEREAAAELIIRGGRS